MTPFSFFCAPPASECVCAVWLDPSIENPQASFVLREYPGCIVRIALYTESPRQCWTLLPDWRLWAHTLQTSNVSSFLYVWATGHLQFDPWDLSPAVGARMLWHFYHARGSGEALTRYPHLWSARPLDLIAGCASREASSASRRQGKLYRILLYMSTLFVN